MTCDAHRDAGAGGAAPSPRSTQIRGTILAPADGGMRPEAGGVSGEPAGTNAGYPRPAGRCAGSHAKEEKSEEAQRQPAAPSKPPSQAAFLGSAIPATMS